MKKALIYIAMAGLLFMSSCVHELVPSDKVEWKGTGTTLKLTVKVSDSPKTKADTRPGDDDGDYNENKIYTLDYFIFDVNPTENVSAVAVLKGRLTLAEGSIVIDDNNECLFRSTPIDLSEVFDEDNMNVTFIP